MKPGLAEMKNAIIVPHIASASKVTLLHVCVDLPVASSVSLHRYMLYVH